MGVALEAAPMDLAAGHLQGGEEAGGAIMDRADWQPGHIGNAG